MGRGAAIGESLIEREVRQGQARERRVQIVSRVDSDRAVENINAVTTQAAT